MVGSIFLFFFFSSFLVVHLGDSPLNDVWGFQLPTNSIGEILIEVDKYVHFQIFFVFLKLCFLKEGAC